MLAKKWQNLLQVSMISIGFYGKLMATIKIAELQSAKRFEELSDADLKAIRGGDSQPEFQLITGGTSATTGAAAGGRVQNSTNSEFNLNGGLEGPFFNVSVIATANSFSSPT